MASVKTFRRHADRHIALADKGRKLHEKHQAAIGAFHDAARKHGAKSAQAKAARARINKIKSQIAATSKARTAAHKAALGALGGSAKGPSKKGPSKKGSAAKGRALAPKKGVVKTSKRPGKGGKRRVDPGR